MSTSNKTSITSRTLQFTKIVAAIAQYLTAAIVLGGKSITPRICPPLFSAALQAESDLEAARLGVVAKKQARDAALSAALAAVTPLQKYLAGTYGEESTTYAAFGLPVAKTPVKSAEVKAAAAAKATATRKAHKAALASATPSTPATAPAATAATTATK